MNIYLIRHGQTTGDVENRYGGDYDDHLTDLGNMQAQDVAKELTNLGIEKLFASPKIRAQETASIVGKSLGIKVATLTDFRERNSYGILTGMRKSDAKENHPDQVDLLEDTGLTVIEAEPYVDFGVRIENAVDELVKEDIKTLAVVTHGGPIRFILREIVGYGDVSVGNCAYALLESNGIKLQAKKLNGINKI